jgi:2-oxoacid:acceptor oxidoreductase delta subunit (pyruvate/2-ketoisovalerate family)
MDKNARAIQVDPVTLETKTPGVFAGGDITTGPASIIEAIGAGKRAAESINLYLTGQDMHLGRDENIEETTWAKDTTAIKKKQRRYEAKEEKPKLTLEQAQEYVADIKREAMFEAFRCLGCGTCAECLANTDLCEGDKAIVDEDHCIGCNVCTVVCPYQAIKKNEKEIAQVDEDLCKGCGVCAARCPERAITMKKLTNERILSLACVTPRSR